MDYPPTFEQQFERHDSCVLYSGILLIPVCPIMAWNKVSNRLDLDIDSRLSRKVLA